MGLFDQGSLSGLPIAPTVSSVIDRLNGSGASSSEDPDLNNTVDAVVDMIKDSLQDSSDTSAEQHKSDQEWLEHQYDVSFQRSKELMQFQFDLQRAMRSTQMQDTIADLKKAGINPAVYFGFGGSPNSSQGITNANVGAPSSPSYSGDTISNLFSAVGSVLTAIASNKNADSAVFRSIIGALGSIFSVGIHSSNIAGQYESSVTRR